VKAFVVLFLLAASCAHAGSVGAAEDFGGDHLIAEPTDPSLPAISWRWSGDLASPL